MASSSRTDASGVTRKLIRLGVAVVVVIALYTGGWFYVASRVKETVDRELAASEQGMHSASCSNLSVRGFPFRIGLFCDSVALDDRPTGLSATFGALRSAAQVYRPGHAVLELDGPAQLRITPDLVFDADWDLLRASATAWTNGLDRASLAYDGLKGRLNVPSEGISIGVAATHGEKHIRQSGAALDLAASFSALSLDLGDRALPPLDVAVDMTISDAAKWISTEGPPADAPLGASVELRRLSLDLGDGKVAALSGPLKVGDDGYLSGSLDLDISGIVVWRDRISEAFPEIADTAAQVAQAIEGLSKGNDRAVVKLKVEDGTVYLGLFPIAFIPPF
ncbi:DUF2125 domain-containing protein [Shinella sp. CPCC 101442]|uniref:DUF2125 domain-containing protein n=1 Tax=Shinella sp. CPCC 101442 TaxID=2932265 RepID=UPI0021529B09|nr:DUF2125 domain-containing protein [Shinella sp. CPCC 101442]MCR6502636.1 DUF2125 domain-containing protein [Shinella sp. CPCC 101442]